MVRQGRGAIAFYVIDFLEYISYADERKFAEWTNERVFLFS
jgi:hypothetical protein